MELVAERVEPNHPRRLTKGHDHTCRPRIPLPPLGGARRDCLGHHRPPRTPNALTSNMYFGIRRAVDRVNASRNLHALAVTGTGDVFAPGGELGGQHDDGDVNIGELLGTGAVPFDSDPRLSQTRYRRGQRALHGGWTADHDALRCRDRERASRVRRPRAQARRGGRLSRGDPPRARRHRARPRHVVHGPAAHGSRGGAARAHRTGRTARAARRDHR